MVLLQTAYSCRGIEHDFAPVYGFHCARPHSLRAAVIKTACGGGLVTAPGSDRETKNERKNITWHTTITASCDALDILMLRNLEQDSIVVSDAYFPCCL